VADGHVVLDHQSAAVDYRAFLDIDVVAQDDLVFSIRPNGHAGPNTAVLSNLHITNYICELTDPGRFRYSGSFVPESPDQTAPPYEAAPAPAVTPKSTAFKTAFVDDRLYPILGGGGKL
jgi:hypothetical protein